MCTVQIHGHYIMQRVQEFIINSLVNNTKDLDFEGIPVYRNQITQLTSRPCLRVLNLVFRGRWLLRTVWTTPLEMAPLAAVVTRIGTKTAVRGTTMAIDL